MGIKYLGTAQQLTNEYGFYNGNENVNDVPQHVIDAGKEIMEIGVSKGFFGVAGFDLLVDKNNDVFAIDLNFRQNGSTSMLLLAKDLAKGYHKFYSYFSNGDNTHFIIQSLNISRRVFFIHFHIMMAIGMAKIK